MGGRIEDSKVKLDGEQSPWKLKPMQFEELKRNLSKLPTINALTTVAQANTYSAEPQQEQRPRWYSALMTPDKKSSLSNTLSSSGSVSRYDSTNLVEVNVDIMTESSNALQNEEVIERISKDSKKEDPLPSISQSSNQLTSLADSPKVNNNKTSLGPVSSKSSQTKLPSPAASRLVTIFKTYTSTTMRDAPTAGVQRSNSRTSSSSKSKTSQSL